MRMYGVFMAVMVSIALTFSAQAAVVWSGPAQTFLKTGAQSPALVQDVLTSAVSLTRGSVGFLYNAAAGETSGDPFNFPNAPAGTEWAFAGLEGNPVGAAFSATNFAALSFDTFVNALGGPGPAGGGGANSGIGNVIVNQPGVAHLVAEDIYFDIQFIQWTNPLQGAIVEYSRTTVPLPAALPLFAIACGCLHRRRRASRHRALIYFKDSNAPP